MTRLRRNVLLNTKDIRVIFLQSQPCFPGAEASLQLLFGLSNLLETAGMLRPAEHDRCEFLHTFSPQAGGK